MTRVFLFSFFEKEQIDSQLLFFSNNTLLALKIDSFVSHENFKPTEKHLPGDLCVRCPPNIFHCNCNKKYTHSAIINLPVDDPKLSI